MANETVAEASGFPASASGSRPKRDTKGVGPDGGRLRAWGEA